MAKLWEDVKTFVKKGAAIAAERIEEETTLWKIHREIANFEKDVERKKIEIGGHIFELVKNNPKASIKVDEKVATLVKEIEALNTQIAEKQVEYEEVKKQSGEKSTPSTKEDTEKSEETALLDTPEEVIVAEEVAERPKEESK
ncbi:hypothetical protein JW964_27215 [candidate division KSB1 bacterium]|nr:hypothetical protein [candidate division KSB1 bacterium]